MSYDLHFRADPAPPPDAFEDHFRGRRNYTVREGSAYYANEDTGVYFAFETTNALEDEADFEDASDTWASFNLNYARPGFFAREAAIELRAFVDRFGSSIDDPQIEGMSEGEFTPEGFLRGWTRGNSFARAALSARGAEVGSFTRSAEELDRIWAWNYARNDEQGARGENIFVPRIAFFAVGKRLVSASVWTDAIPVVLPRTDVVLVYRDELAPRRWFRRRRGFAMVEWDEAAGRLGVAPTTIDTMPCVVADYGEAPGSIVEWIAKLPDAPSLDAVPMDSVLDAV